MSQKLVYSKINTKNGQLGYIKVGCGQKSIVMINRYGATLYNWDRDLISLLSNDFTLYLFDWRMVGYSQSNNSEDIEGCIKDIHDGITALKIDNPILLGWSFGGVIVQQYYDTYPNKVSGMVLLSTFPDAKMAVKDFVELSMVTNTTLDSDSKIKLYQLLLSELPSNNSQNLLNYNTLDIDNYDYRYTSNIKELHNKFVLTSHSFDAKELSQIQVPCLILNANDDRSFPHDAWKYFIQNIPNSKLVVYSYGGHLLIHRNGIAVALDIINYFGKKQSLH